MAFLKIELILISCGPNEGRVIPPRLIRVQDAISCQSFLHVRFVTKNTFSAAQIWTKRHIESVFYATKRVRFQIHKHLFFLSSQQKMTYKHLGESPSFYWQHITYFHRLNCEIDQNLQQLQVKRERERDISSFL